MSYALRLAAFALVLSAGPAPVMAGTGMSAPSAFRACMAEAQWAVESSAAYRYGSARERQQLRNSVNADVRTEENLCRGLRAGGDKAALMDRCDSRAAAVEQAYGDRSLGHAARLRGICRAMTGA